MIAYRAHTEDIAVTVRPCFLAEESDPVNRQFVFGLGVQIDNRGDEEVELLKRHWFVRDDRGRTRENEEASSSDHPLIIAPGEDHRCTSTCVIPTFRGALEGSLLLQHRTGQRFRANVPLVLLRALVN